ncbi:MAG: histidine triad nucleotide-binding protein [Planctomycetota bacterium]|jgi:histidine triad (HIT) family protein
MITDPDCLFCKIVDGVIPSDAVYRDERCMAFRDINPQAPVHILVIPLTHVARMSHTTDEEAPLLGHLLRVAARIAESEEVSEDGFRVVINNGKNGGQEVDHLHLHILGGRSMTWPPG